MAEIIRLRAANARLAVEAASYLAQLNGERRDL
jgi:hypothetical protein